LQENISGLSKVSTDFAWPRIWSNGGLLQTQR
jgi:hypothetical protein